MSPSDFQMMKLDWVSKRLGYVRLVDHQQKRPSDSSFHVVTASTHYVSTVCLATILSDIILTPE